MNPLRNSVGRSGPGGKLNTSISAPPLSVSNREVLRTAYLVYPHDSHQQRNELGAMDSLRPFFQTEPVEQTQSAEQDDSAIQMVNNFAAGIIKRIWDLDSAVVSHDELNELCMRVKEIFLAEKSLLRLDANIFIFGDIHGQVGDLKAMLNKIGTPPLRRVLFLGDYVDRGPHSIQAMSLLLAMKLRFPSLVFLLRGNHETRLVNRGIYGFFQECTSAYGTPIGLQVWSLFNSVFNCLPVAALIAERIFCVHGGISDALSSFSQFNRMRRPMDIADVGVVVDLIWADPSTDVQLYAPSHRGVGNVFGREGLDKFCNALGIDLVVRAHQCKKDGYSRSMDGRLITIFSAPNYDAGNAAAILHILPSLKAQIYTFRRVSASKMLVVEKKKN